MGPRNDPGDARLRRPESGPRASRGEPTSHVRLDANALPAPTVSPADTIKDLSVRALELYNSRKDVRPEQRRLQLVREDASALFEDLLRAESLIREFVLSRPTGRYMHLVMEQTIRAARTLTYLRAHPEMASAVNFDHTAELCDFRYLKIGKMLQLGLRGRGRHLNDYFAELRRLQPLVPGLTAAELMTAVDPILSLTLINSDGRPGRSGYRTAAARNAIVVHRQ